MRRSFVFLLACACAHDPAPQDCSDTDDTCTSTSTGADSSSSSPSTTATTADTTSPTTADTSEAGSSSSVGATTEPSTSSDTSSGPACSDDSQCQDPDLPLCVDEACVQCSERDTSLCTGVVPICDVGAHTCVGCTMHEQCPGSACQLGDGSCFALDVVLHVDGDETSCILADGSEMAPYCTIADALDEIGPASRGVLRVAAASAPYLEPFAITGDRIVAIVAWGEASPIFDVVAAEPTLLVDGATAYLWRVRFEGNASDPAIVLDDALAYIERAEIVQNDGGGIQLAADTELHLWNSVIGLGGNGVADRHAIDADASTFDVLTTTIAGNDGTGPASLVCSGGASGTIRNSIVVGLDPPSIQCAAAEVATSAIDSAGLGGADVIVLDAFNAGWFVDAALGDFHLVQDTLFDDLGIREAGDPIVDLDGDPRPTRDGALDVAGADVP